MSLDKCMELPSPPQSLTLERSLLPLCCLSSPTPSPRQSRIRSVATAVLPFLELHGGGIAQYGLFLVLASFPHTRVLSITHSVAYMGPLFSIAEQYSAVWTCQFVHPSPADGHLGCFQFGATMNKAAVDT